MKMFPPSTAREACSWMEEVCSIFASNPQAAEAELMKLRHSPHAHSICAAILDTSNQPLAQFHVLCTMQVISINDIESCNAGRKIIWSWLLAENSKLSRQVISKALQVIAVLWKHRWLSETHSDKEKFLSSLAALLRSSNDFLIMLLGVKALLALVCEFGGTMSKAGLPLEVHKDARESFGKHGLPEAVRYGTEFFKNVVEQVVQVGNLDDASQAELLSISIQFCIEALSWQEKEVEPWEIPTSNTLIRPGTFWKPFLFGQDLFKVFFLTYGIVCHSPYRAISNDLRQFLLLLASVEREIFEDHAPQQLYYVVSFLECFCEMAQKPLQGASENDRELFMKEQIDLASMFSKIITNFGLLYLAAIPKFQALVGIMQGLTRTILDATAAAVSSGDSTNEMMYMECLDELLMGWVLVVGDKSVNPNELSFNRELRNAIATVAYSIYEPYVLWNITVSKQKALQCASVDGDDDEEAIDAVKSNEQRTAVTSIGRKCAFQSLTFLTSILANQLQRLEVMLNTGTIDGSNAIVQQQQLLSDHAICFLEECGIVVSFVGHFLADSIDDDGAMVPEDLQEPFSLEDMAVSAAINLSSMLISGIISDIKLAVSSSSIPKLLLSPHMIGQCLESVTRWANTYLCIDESEVLYFKLHDKFYTAFGKKDGEGGSVICDILLSAAWSLLNFFPNEPVVCEQAIKLLKVLSGSTVGVTAGHLPRWKAIMNMIVDLDHVQHATCDQGFSQLCPRHHGEILLYMLAGTLESMKHSRSEQISALNHYVSSIAMRTRSLNEAISNKPLTERHTPQIITAAEVTLELWRGVSRLNTEDIQEQIGAVVVVEGGMGGIIFILQALGDFSDSIVSATLNLLHDAAEQLILNMRQQDVRIFCKICGSALEIYSSQHGGFGGSTEDFSKEELECILDLLSHLISKDLVDYSSESETTQLEESSIGDIVFYGLAQVMPLLTQNLLQYPSLAMRFFKLISLVVEIYTYRFASLDAAQFDRMMKSILFGIQQENSTSARYCLRAIRSILIWHMKCTESGLQGLHGQINSWPSFMRDLLGALLQLVVFQNAVWDRLDACAEALLPIIVCDQQGYKELTSALTEQQPPEVRQRLSTSFHVLVTEHNLEMNLSRSSRRTFIENLRRFSGTVRSFLLYK